VYCQAAALVSKALYISLAPHATLIEHWKKPEYHLMAKQAVERLLAEHTPR
jgi:hypothetical protein